MEPNHIAGFVLATALWLGLAACTILGGSIRPPSEFWTSTSSLKVASHPTLVRAAYPAAHRPALADRAVVAAQEM
jgi:hypothetical protein